MLSNRWLSQSRERSDPSGDRWIPASVCGSLLSRYGRKKSRGRRENAGRLRRTEVDENDETVGLTSRREKRQMPKGARGRTRRNRRTERGRNTRTSGRRGANDLRASAQGRQGARRERQRRILFFAPHPPTLTKTSGPPLRRPRLCSMVVDLSPGTKDEEQRASRLSLGKADITDIFSIRSFA